VSTQAARASRAREQEWWRRLPALITNPRPFFAALADDSDDATEARQEPLIAVAFLAGISIFLSTNTAAHVFDDADIRNDALLLLVEAIFAGALVAIQNVWIVGGALHLGARALDGEGSYRQARAVVGFASAPFILSLLLVWPVRLAVYGGDLFTRGGADEGVGGDVFRWIDAAFGIWALGLLLLGVRTVNGWSWLRTLGAAALTALVFAGIAFVLVAL
jgi:hypothetical protein